jgi:DNA-binding NtrC family response regulator
VRELRNVIEHLVVMAAPGTEVHAADIVFIDEEAAATNNRGPSFGAELMKLDYHNARDWVLAKFEVAYLTHVVEASGGNISDAARMAGVDRTTLYRLMDKHGMGGRA